MGLSVKQSSVHDFNKRLHLFKQIQTSFNFCNVSQSNCLVVLSLALLQRPTMVCHFWSAVIPWASVMMSWRLAEGGRAVSGKASCWQWLVDGWEASSRDQDRRLEVMNHAGQWAAEGSRGSASSKEWKKLTQYKDMSIWKSPVKSDCSVPQKDIYKSCSNFSYWKQYWVVLEVFFYSFTCTCTCAAPPHGQT